MTKFTFHMGIDVRAYGNVEIEAATVEEAVALLTPDNVSDKFERGEVTWDGPSNLTIIDARDSDGNDLPAWGQHDIVDPRAPVYTQEQLEDALAEHGEKVMRRIGRLAVIIDGGLVQAIVTDGPMLLGIPVTVIDYDVEGADGDRLSGIDQGDSTSTPASVEVHEITRAKIIIPGDESGAYLPVQGMLKTVRDLLDGAVRDHIFDEANGEKPEPDDPYMSAIRSLDHLMIAMATGSPLAGDAATDFTVHVPHGFRFEAGKTYPRRDGHLVTIVAEKNDNRGYECVQGDDRETEEGGHRYNRSTSRSDLGRATATQAGGPLDLIPVAVDIAAVV